MAPVIVRRFFFFINLALVTLLIFYGVKIFYGVVTGHLDAAIVSGGSEPGPVTSVKRGTDSPSTPRQIFLVYRPIITRDLFKTNSAENMGEKALTAAEIENLRKTELKVELWGTITGNAGSEYAVIEDTTRREQLLCPEGGTVKNARIKMVLREKVVLSVEGKDEILEMEKPVEGGLAISSGNAREDYADTYNRHKNEVFKVYRERLRKKAEIRRQMAQSR